jgi:hypothetical protein
MRKGGSCGCWSQAVLTPPHKQNTPVLLRDRNFYVELLDLPLDQNSKLNVNNEVLRSMSSAQEQGFEEIVAKSFLVGIRFTYVHVQLE